MITIKGLKKPYKTFLLILLSGKLIEKQTKINAIQAPSIYPILKVISPRVIGILETLMAAERFQRPVSTQSREKYLADLLFFPNINIMDDKPNNIIPDKTIIVAYGENTIS